MFFEICRALCQHEHPSLGTMDTMGYDQKQAISTLIFARNDSALFFQAFSQSGWLLSHITDPARQEDFSVLLRDHGKHVIEGVLTQWQTLHREFARQKYWDTTLLIAQHDTKGREQALGFLFDHPSSLSYWDFAGMSDDLFGQSDTRDMVLTHMGTLTRYDRLIPVMMIWDRVLLRPTGITERQLLEVVVERLRSLEDLDELFAFEVWQNRAEMIFSFAMAHERFPKIQTDTLDYVLPFRARWRLRQDMISQWGEKGIESDPRKM